MTIVITWAGLWHVGRWFLAFGAGFALGAFWVNSSMLKAWGGNVW